SALVAEGEIPVQKTCTRRSIGKFVSGAIQQHTIIVSKNRKSPIAFPRPKQVLKNNLKLL
ncbi:hypothetical protein, partial [Victivallis vadensis]|uniref:hypothetical protein n=1 Tax=Victivallis vadensis TaxID=172901 RepID=UPI00266D0F26